MFSATQDENASVEDEGSAAEEKPEDVDANHDVEDRPFEVFLRDSTKRSLRKEQEMNERRKNLIFQKLPQKHFQVIVPRITIVVMIMDVQNQRLSSMKCIQVSMGHIFCNKIVHAHCQQPPFMTQIQQSSQQASTTANPKSQKSPQLVRVSVGPLPAD